MSKSEKESSPDDLHVVSGLSVDVPIAGSKVLMDSVMEFLNREMYDFFERWEEDSRHFPYGEVRSNDAVRFVQSYASRYAPFITLENDWSWEYDMVIVLVSQTDSFVTYGVENRRFEAHCHESFSFFTFSKMDGHLVKEVINPKDNTLYIPLPENVMMGHHVCADRYSVCQFDGNHFKYVRDDGGFWLHPSVRQFERMLLYGQADPYLIRVDEMRIYDCRVEGQYEAEKRDSHWYRYAAWKDCDDMQKKPSLVIENGIYKDGDYIFENEGYTYVVKKNSLCIYRGNKQLSSMELEKYVEYTD